jgi:predicted nucleic acid-binding protein
VAHYLDTSALTKLVVAEGETDALRSWLTRVDRNPVSSDLTRTELLRVAKRIAPNRVLLAREVLDSITLIELTTEIFEVAGRLDPSILRSLDAVHLAAALSLGDEMESIVTYDERLASAATSNGLATTSPV